MSKLRLILFEECNRACPGCCNKDWDLKSLPVCTSLEGWDEVLLTGGEPMLNPDLVIDTALQVPTGTDVFLYTAKVDDLDAALNVMYFVSGITLTLHEQEDVEPFLKFAAALQRNPRPLQSLRLNVFKGVELPDTYRSVWNRWAIKSNMQWIKDCPLPANEVMMRYRPAR